MTAATTAASDLISAATALDIYQTKVWTTPTCKAQPWVYAGKPDVRGSGLLALLMIEMDAAGIVDLDDKAYAAMQRAVRAMRARFGNR